MGLFENGREANRASCITMIEHVLSELGHDPRPTRGGTATEPSWTFPHGSATVRVALVDREDFVHVRVTAPVMTTDARVNVLALYGHLLALHAEEVYGAAFAAQDREILLIAERSTLDLDRSEVVDTIQRVADYANRFDDELVAKFGGHIGRR